MRWAGLIARVGRGETCTRFWWGNLREREHWGDPGVDGDNNKTYLQEVGCGCLDWIELVRDRDRWWTLWNAVMNLRIQ